jgi:hypothetical protein
MGSAVVITIDLCPRRPALYAKCRAQSTYGSGQNCSGAIADPPVAPGSARSGSRNCLNARVREVWRSNGFASSFVAGKIGSLMTRADIWPRSPNETHRSLRSLLGQSCEILWIPCEQVREGR